MVAKNIDARYVINIRLYIRIAKAVRSAASVEAKPLFPLVRSGIHSQNVVRHACAVTSTRVRSAIDITTLLQQHLAFIS